MLRMAKPPASPGSPSVLTLARRAVGSSSPYSCGVFRSHHLARATPGRPEVDDEWDVSALEVPLEAGRGELEGMAREEALVAVPAFRRLPEARRRNAVYPLAVRTHDVQRFGHFADVRRA